MIGNGNGTYILEKVIGKGAFGDVYLATNVDKEYVAVKQVSYQKIRKNPILEGYYVDEVLIMEKINKLNNPNLLRMIKHYKTNNNLYIVMEYYNQGNLLENLKQKKLDQQDSIKYFR